MSDIETLDLSNLCETSQEEVETDDFEDSE